MTAADPGQAYVPASGGDGSSRPVPDPTALTDAAIAKAVTLLTTYIDGKDAVTDARLKAMEHATTLRLQTIDDMPDRVKEEVQHAEGLAKLRSDADARYSVAEVAHLREVDDIRFQAAERLAGRESELNALALAAAFAAQKEASAKEAEYTRIASIKSESATAQAIDKLGELFATQNRGLGDKLDDLKDRVTIVEALKLGGQEQRTEGRQSNAAVYAALASITGFILFTIVVVGVIIEANK